MVSSYKAQVVVPSCVQTSCSASLAPQTASKRCRVTLQGFHRCRGKVVCGVRGCCANFRKKHVFTDPRNDHLKLRCAVFFAARHLDDLHGVCCSRRQRQAKCVKPQTLKTATCMHPVLLRSWGGSTGLGGWRTAVCDCQCSAFLRAAWIRNAIML